MKKLFDLVLGAVYGATIGYWLGFQLLPTVAIPAVAVLVALGTLLNGTRAALRGLAGIHIIVSLLAIRIFIRSLNPNAGDSLAWTIGLYVLANVTVPALVVAFLSSGEVSEPDPGMPPSAIYLNSSHHRLTAGSKLVIIVLATLIVPLSLMGGIFVALIALPTVFAVYHLVSILLGRRQATPVAQRRMKIPRAEAARTQQASTHSVIPIDNLREK